MSSNTPIIPDSEVSVDPTTPIAPGSTPIIPDSGELTLVENLDGTFADDYDFVFVVLPGSDSDLTTEVARHVIEAAVTIQAQDMISVGTFILSMDNPESTNPSVLALSKDGRKYQVDGIITETQLLQVYLGTCGPASSCSTSPGSSSGCCP